MCASLAVTWSLLTGSVTPIRVSHFRGAVQTAITGKQSTSVRGAAAGVEGMRGQHGDDTSYAIFVAGRQRADTGGSSENWRRRNTCVDKGPTIWPSQAV